MSIESTIYNRLNTTTITDLVSSRIYVTDPETNTNWPYLVWTVSDAAPVTSMAGGTSLTLYTVDIDLWARSLSQLTSLQNAVRQQLHCYRGGNIQRAALADQGDEKIEGENEGDIYYGTQKYQVWATPSGNLSATTGGRYEQVNVILVEDDYTASLQDQFIFVDASSTAITVTLPEAARGKMLTVKKIDTTGNYVTVEAQSGEQIDGSNGQDLTSPYTAFNLVAYEENWHVV